MIRTIAILSLAALAACSSGGPSPVTGAAIEELRGLWPGKAPAPEGPPRRAVTRADITAADVAAIRARLSSDPAPTLMFASAENGGYVTYVSPLRQAITLRGAAQITATRGLGTDLLSARSLGTDPLARAIPPAQWPRGVRRIYEFPAAGARGRIETFDCSFEFGDTRELVILQRRYRGVEVSETCVGPAGTFENLHFADAQTGFVWRSLQWVGPEMELIDLQIIEPYTG